MTAAVSSLAADVAAAAALLRAGGLVAFPTETVYGLGADARNPAAVARIFAVKARPGDNPLIVHLADASELPRAAARVSPLAQRLARRFWPGPLTLVVDAAPEIPAATTANLASVAVRVPDHPVALALIRAGGVPIAAPSANRSGRPSPTTAQHVHDDLGGEVDLVLDGGACRFGVESTVVDARGEQPVVLREGAVTREQLGLADRGGDPSAAASAASPGTRHRHYAPRCPVVIAAIGQGPALAQRLAAGGARVGLVATAAGGPDVCQLARFDGADALGRLLYDALRRAEASAVDLVVVESVAERGIGRAVMDRLRRAAAS